MRGTNRKKTSGYVKAQASIQLKVARNCEACELDVPSLAFLVEIFWISRHRGQVFAITTVQQLVTRMAGLFAIHPEM